MPETGERWSTVLPLSSIDPPDRSWLATDGWRELARDWRPRILVRTGHGAPRNRPRRVDGDAIARNLVGGRGSFYAMPTDACSSHRALRQVSCWSSATSSPTAHLRRSFGCREAGADLSTTRQMVAGGGANAANNVAALGGHARLAGIVGRDAEGGRCPVFSAWSGPISSAPQYRTPVKTRILAAASIPPNSKSCGSIATAWPLSDDVSRVFAKLVAVRNCDAVLSDYGSGLVTGSLNDCAALARARGPPGADPRRFPLPPARAWGMTTRTPNSQSNKSWARISTTIPDALERPTRRLAPHKVRRWWLPAVAVAWRFQPRC